MDLERWQRLIAGALVLTSLALGWFHSPYWLVLTAFVGLNLFQSGFTNWCLIDERPEGVRCEGTRCHGAGHEGRNSIENPIQEDT